MIWLTWRQHRMPMIEAALAFAGLCLALVVIGQGVRDTFAGSGLEACLAAGRGCAELRQPFDDKYQGLQLLIPLTLACPLLIGLFWGAPMVSREVEHGTHRFVWTQSVSRHRWLVTKLALLGAAAVGAAAVYSAVSTWFAEPFAAVNGNRMSNGLFDLTGITPISYTLFAFAVGVAAGAVLRKVVPAMGATLVAYIAARGVVAGLVRSHLLPTRTRTYDTLGGREADMGDWVVSGRIVTKTGELFSTSRDLSLNPGTISRWCPDIDLASGQLPDQAPLHDCLTSLGLRTTEAYHPASQFWTLQAIEAGLFLAATAALIAFTVWWVRRIA